MGKNNSKKLNVDLETEVNILSAEAEANFEAMAASGYLYSKTEFTKIINFLGALWKHAIAYANATTDTDYIYGANADSFMYLMQSLRSECATGAVNDLTSDSVNQPTHYDNANILTNAIRNIEKGLPASFKNLISPIIISYNSFIMNQKGVQTKVWFDTGGAGNTDKFSADDWITLFTPEVDQTVNVDGIGINGVFTTDGVHNLSAGTPVRLVTTSGSIIQDTTYYVKTGTVAASTSLSLVYAATGAGAAIPAATVAVTGIASDGTITTSGNHGLSPLHAVQLTGASGLILAATTYYVKVGTVAASNTLTLCAASTGDGATLTGAEAEADAATANTLNTAVATPNTLVVQNPQTRFGNEFLALWRYATSQELRVPICKFTYNGATWDKVVTNYAGALTNAVQLQARWTQKSATTTSITITAFTPAGGTAVTTNATAMTAAYVPAGTATGYTNLGTAAYTDIDSITATGVASTEEGTAPDDDPDVGDVITIYSM